MTELILEKNRQNNLLPTWTVCKLDDACLDIMGGGTPSRKNPEYFHGNIIWLTPTEILKDKILVVSKSKENITYEGLRKSSARIIPKDAVLLTSRATIGSVAIAGKEVTTNQGFASFVCSNLIYNFYLAYWLWTHKSFLENKAKGTTFKEISKSKLRGIVIPIPPLNEQKRIVSKIEELFSFIDNKLNILQNVIIQLKQYKKSLIVSGLNGTLTQDFRKTHKNLIPSKNLLKVIKSKHETKNQYKLNFRKLYDLPQDWSWVTISEIANVVSGNTPKGIEKHRKNDKIPFFKVADMNHPDNSLFMTFSELNLNEQEMSDLKLKKYGEDTIIFPKRGGAILTNKKRIISKPSCFDLNIMGIQPIDIPSKFVYYWLLNIDLASLSDGSNVPQINHGDVNPLPIPIPTKEEIDEIIKIFDNHFSVNEQALVYLQKLINMNQTLRISILKQAFEGKLVPQDPNDEPSKILLQKIKQEKIRLEQKQKIIKAQKRRRINVK